MHWKMSSVIWQSSFAGYGWLEHERDCNSSTQRNAIYLAYFKEMLKKLIHTRHCLLRIITKLWLTLYLFQNMLLKKVEWPVIWNAMKCSCGVIVIPQFQNSISVFQTVTSPIRAWIFALQLAMICCWTNFREAGDLKRFDAYTANGGGGLMVVTVMLCHCNSNPPKAQFRYYKWLRL